jgi:MinD superfamily P-loop ATPase
MKISIASGKGGTGKTTIATNLALTFSREGSTVELMDCDVEEPNCHLFLKPEFETSQTVTVWHPSVDQHGCTACGECSQVCQYGAIALLGEEVIVFPELCHGCGACALLCPAAAVLEVQREIGILQQGHARGFYFTMGQLRIGETQSPPVIRQMKQAAKGADITVIDAPPGTSCPVIEAVKDTDFIILVTEPTPFGLYDLKLATDTVRALALTFAVLINHCDIGDNSVRDFCTSENIAILMEIPDDLRVAKAYSRGELIVEALPEYEDIFRTLADRVRREGNTQ